MAQINGFYIKETPIEYKKTLQKDHYLNDGVFIYVKLFEKIAFQYSQTSKAYYSNAELQEAFGGVSERGLQMAMQQLEKEGIIWRVFKDEETKRHRLGFEVDIDKVYDLLTKRPNDVYQLKRGTLEKHIVMQKTLHMQPFYKELRKAYGLLKKDRNNAKYKAILKDLLQQKHEYDQYVKSTYVKADKSIQQARKRRFSREDVFAGIRDLVIGAGYKPPETLIN